MTTRIYHSDTFSAGDSVTLNTNAANHVSRVLRLKTGDSLTLFNGDGNDYAARITLADRNRVSVEIESQQVNDTESPLSVTLIQGICRNQRMDLLIQKSTELGVQRISPAQCERSVSKIAGGKQVKKAEHWQNIAVSACEQCGRARLPEIAEPCDLAAAINRLSSGTARLMLDPNGDSSLSEALSTDKPVALLIGPEGGLSPQEIEMAVSNGFKRIRLGPRVLRTETAPITALSIIQFLAGDLNR